MRTAALHNLGCKVNAYETEAMRQILEEGGYTIVPFTEKADVYVINTCSVTNIADRKSRQMIHRARRHNPDAVIVAAGCYVQAQANRMGDSAGCAAAWDSEGHTEAEKLGADIIIGNNKKHELLDILDEFFQGRSELAKEADCAGGKTHPDGDKCQESESAKEAGREEVNAEQRADIEAAPAKSPSTEEKSMVRVININDRSEAYEELAVAAPAEHTRAFVKVQDGCNQFCSYCIIPYVRGRVRSRSLENVLEEVRGLAAKGYREIVLTGIHLSSYGVDLRAHEENVSLLDLIRAVCAIDGIKRVRLGSLEPQIVTEEFARELAVLPEVCPHFHLSLQSGCDETLRRMNRRYTTAEYEEGCRLLRKYFDDPAITTDVIAGFPGETEEEFAATKEFLERIHFYEMHIFKYSRRKGTRADQMQDQVPEQVKSARSEELIALGERMSQEYRQRHVGLQRDVLLEEPVEIAGRKYYVGYTPEYIKVAVPIDAEATTIDAETTQAETETTQAETETTQAETEITQAETETTQLNIESMQAGSIVSGRIVGRLQDEIFLLV